MSMKNTHKLSPLLTFKAKANLADFSIPIEIPHKLEPLQQSTNAQSNGLSQANVFTQRLENKIWGAGAESAIRELEIAQLTDKELMEKYFIEPDDYERMEKLKELMEDKDDFVFGDDGIEQVKERKIEANEQSIEMFKGKENLDETEMHIMAFNEIIDSLRELPNTANTLREIRNFFIFRVKEKNELEESLISATRDLDARYYESQCDIENYEEDITAVKEQNEELREKLDREENFNAELKSLNLQREIEKEQLQNQMESRNEQLLQEEAEIKLKTREIDEINNRARRLEIAVNRYRSLSDTAEERLAQENKYSKEFESELEEQRIKNEELQREIEELKEIEQKEFSEIIELQRQIDEGISSTELKRAPKDAPDPIKMGVEALLEISEEVREEELEQEFGLTKDNLICARNIMVAIKDSDYIEDVINAANGICCDFEEKRSVAVEVSTQVLVKEKIVTKQVITPSLQVLKKDNAAKIETEDPLKVQDSAAKQIIGLTKIIEKQRFEASKINKQLLELQIENEKLKEEPYAGQITECGESDTEYEEQADSSSDGQQGAGELDQDLAGSISSDIDDLTEEVPELFSPAHQGLEQLEDLPRNDAITNRSNKASKVSSHRSSKVKDKAQQEALHFGASSMQRRSIDLSIAKVVSHIFHDTNSQLLEISSSGSIAEGQNADSGKELPLDAAGAKQKPRGDKNKIEELISPHLGGQPQFSSDFGSQQGRVPKKSDDRQAGQVENGRRDGRNAYEPPEVQDTCIETMESALEGSVPEKSLCQHFESQVSLLYKQDSIKQEYSNEVTLAGNGADDDLLAVMAKCNSTPALNNAAEVRASDLNVFEPNVVATVTQSQILDQINEIVKSLPEEIRYDRKIDLNEVLFKHIDHQLNKKNFNEFYEKYHALLQERGQQSNVADQEMISEVDKFITNAKTVKTVQKSDYLQAEAERAERFELLNPQVPATSEQIQENNILLRREEAILEEFSIDSDEIYRLSDALFTKYLTQLKLQIQERKESITNARSGAQSAKYTTDVYSDVAPMKTMEQLEQYSKIKKEDFSINVDFITDETLPFESPALIIEQQISSIDDYIEGEEELKIKNFSPPLEHKVVQTEVSQISVNEYVQTDTVVADFMKDSEMVKNIQEMFEGDASNFNVVQLKGLDDDAQIVTAIDQEQIKQETEVESTLLLKPIQYNNLLKQSQIDKDILQLEDLQRENKPKYVESSVIDDDLQKEFEQPDKASAGSPGKKNDELLQLQQQMLDSYKLSSSLAQESAGGLASQALHFEKGLQPLQDFSLSLQRSEIVPPVEVRQRQSLLAAHSLDQTRLNATYEVAKSKLVLDQDEITTRLKAIESQLPTYQDFLRLIKTSEQTNLVDTAFQVLESNLDLHPRFGQYVRFSEKSIVQPPLVDYFQIQHPVDRVYLKYCPSEGDVSESTKFYPVILENADGIESYYNGNLAGGMVQLEHNTAKHFKYQIDIVTFKQQYKPSQQLAQSKQLLPSCGANIKYVRVSALTFSNKSFIPTIFNELAELTNQETEIVKFGSYDYVKLPVENVSFKSLIWTLKLVKAIIFDRMQSQEQYLLITNSEAASTFVTAASDARKVRFTILPGQLARREAESLSAYFVSWATKKYGVKTIILQLAWNLIINLAYYQYENDEIYLFSRMFFEDLEPDYFLLYIELRRILDLKNKEENVTEMITTKSVPSIAATILKNWEPKREYSFVENVFSILYSKEENDIFSVPKEMNFIEFCEMILYAYGSFRRTAFQQAGLVFNYLAAEENTGELLGEAGFRQLCQILVPEWNSHSVSEMFYAFSVGSDTDLSQRRMALANLQDMFISLELGRFSGVSADILEQTVSLDLKKLIKSSAFVFEQMTSVTKQIIQMLMRHAALRNGEKYIKYTKILKCYVDVIECDIMAFDFVNALANMKLVLSTIIEGLLEIVPDACIVAIGGSMTALKSFFTIGMM